MRKRGSSGRVKGKRDLQALDNCFRWPHLPELIQRQLYDLALQMGTKRVWRYGEGAPVVMGKAP